MKNSPLNLLDLIRCVRGMLTYHEHGWGMIFLGGVLFTLSLLASLQPGHRTGLYLAGEIAAEEVVADRDLLVEDARATQMRREQAQAMQPQIFDLDRESIARFRNDVLALLLDINTKGEDRQGLEALTAAFNGAHGLELPVEDMRLLYAKPVQDYLTGKALPWLEARMTEGVLPDMRQIGVNQSTLLIRDPDSGAEILRNVNSSLHDQRSLTVAFGQMLRQETQLRSQERSALLDVLPVLFLPSLAVNKDATAQRNSEVVRTLEPTFYRVQKGEVVVRPGDTVSQEQQLKMQGLFRSSGGLIDPYKFMGTLLVSIFLALGLYMTPSSVKGTVLRNKDQCFIGLLILGFSLLALGMQHFFFSVAGAASATALPYFFPVAGGAGLAALIFSARRYCVLGLLLSYFAAIMFKGGIALFLFFFLASMCNTWLVLRAQSRQDVVWGGLPLWLWMVVTALGTAMLDRMDLSHMGTLFIALGVNAVLSVLLLFALSPILEMALGYTTRFRLMELMNLEQPLLQEMMMTMPGTYHHSLVVSNLVEAAAKVMGANSLLCKVGALYHDIGKLMHPNYFVENQFGGPNPHDKLSPAMSALILSAHVKKGTELAADHKLGAEISDIIRQHHGTRSMIYFYRKAQDAGENPRAEDFCYPGPRPQTREAAIVMVADAVEASSRTLADPTPARIRSHVDSILKGIFSEGQLDESDLTFQDLHKLSESFVRILTGLFHQRIAYPDRKDLKAASATAAVPTGAEPRPEARPEGKGEHHQEGHHRCREHGDVSGYGTAGGITPEPPRADSMRAEEG